MPKEAQLHTGLNSSCHFPTTNRQVYFLALLKEWSRAVFQYQKSAGTVSALFRSDFEPGS
jgi:hypothetical protein